MNETQNTLATDPSEAGATKGVSIPVWVLASLIIGGLTLVCWYAEFYVHGKLNVWYCLIMLFLATNLFVCYLEIILFRHREYIDQRSHYWIRLKTEQGISPAVAFLTSPLPLKKLLSPTLLADTFAAYAYYDEPCKENRSFGYMADITNGFCTPLPTIFLMVTFTVGLIDPVITGIVGVMMFWQWASSASIYWTSFVLSDAHKKISTRDAIIWVWFTNFPWIFFALIGLYVSIMMILNGDYSVLGH